MGAAGTGKKVRYLQKTRNNHHVYQEWEAMPTTILHTLPWKGGRICIQSERRGRKPSKREVVGKTLDHLADSEEDLPLAKWDYLLPLGRGECCNPKNQGMRRQQGYRCASPRKNPSRTGRHCLDHGSAITRSNLWGTNPGTISARRRRSKVRGRVGVFTTCEDDWEHHNQREGLFVTVEGDREHHNLVWDN
jgi:hypothetical protein